MSSDLGAKTSSLGGPTKGALLCALRGCLGLVAAALLLVWSSEARAHGVNESYIYFDVAEDSLTGRVEITLNDLTRIQQDSETVEVRLTKAQVVDQRSEFTDYLEDRLRLSREGNPYQIEFENISFFGTKGKTFAQFYFTVSDIEKTPVTIDIAYNGMFTDVDPTHRGFALIASNTRNNMDENEAYISLVFSPGDGVKTLYLNDEPSKDIARTFFEFGIWQFWLGFGHLLFLVTLLLGAVVRVDDMQRVPSENIGTSLRSTVKIVAAFAVAHSATLWMAALLGITLPKTVIDAAIVMSIAVVAFGNLFPRFHGISWKVVVLFGVFHGFGFANALEQLGLDPARKAFGLATFNLGIEIGLLAVVLVLFPVFYALRTLTAYRVVGLQVGSVALIVVTLFWFYERTVGALPTPVANAGVLSR